MRQRQAVRLRGAAWAVFCVALLMSSVASGQQRFPPPDFETGYTQPALQLQTRQTFPEEALAAGLLLLAMGFGAWALLWRRSRRMIFVLAVACLLYFGFYRGGCLCPIGAVQNVMLALSDPSYVVPLLALVLSVAPLVMALFLGRVFCGTACPLGAIQDIFLFRPVRVPRWLDEGLGLLRYVVLGVVVYAAAAGSFLMCRYDPFVAFFRFSGSAGMLAFGGALLILGMFVGRPFCRYLCPYGALLSLAAKWTSRGVSVTPDECINCTLCRDACPFGAIVPPRSGSRMSRRMRAFLWGMAILSIVVCSAGGYVATGRTVGGLILGLWFAVVIVAKLLSLSVLSERETYEVDHAKCFACARCYLSCPRERARLKGEGEPVES